MSVDRTKFETCKHRSENEDVILEQGCCSVITLWGYTCKRLNIHGNAERMPLLCEMCTNAYEAKETGN